MHPGLVDNVWLTSVAFSSAMGQKSILAVGRSDGTLVFLSPQSLRRIGAPQPCPVACLSWRPCTTLRPSRDPLHPGLPVPTEELAVGDDMGSVYYYAVEWPSNEESTQNSWPGTVYLLGKMTLHTQQICGLSWSPDGSLLASGGNDNLCCLVDVPDFLSQIDAHNEASWVSSPVSLTDFPYNSQIDRLTVSGGRMNGTVEEKTNTAATPRPIRRFNGVLTLTPGKERHRWMHSAAVKAIAFCPWRDGLVAAGGGSNDKCIHFYHTSTGAALATISVSAQVTSLIWSSTRREIAATFGYAQPDHPFRIAVFSWPSCRQVVAIPWDGEPRALYAIPYPCGPDQKRTSSGATEGSIVVASSDESVKFYQVWPSGKRAVVGGPGSLGGSDILEGIEGIDKEGEVIR